MNKTQAIETLDALDRGTEMKDMTEREVMSEILQAWVRMPPIETRRIVSSAEYLRKASPQLGERGVIELAAKLGMFMRKNAL